MLWSFGAHAARARRRGSGSAFSRGSPGIAIVRGRLPRNGHRSVADREAEARDRDRERQWIGRCARTPSPRSRDPSACASDRGAHEPRAGDGHSPCVACVVSLALVLLPCVSARRVVRARSELCGRVEWPDPAADGVTDRRSEYGGFCVRPNHTNRKLRGQTRPSLASIKLLTIRSSSM